MDAVAVIAALPADEECVCEFTPWVPVVLTARCAACSAGTLVLFRGKFVTGTRRSMTAARVLGLPRGRCALWISSCTWFKYNGWIYGTCVNEECVSKVSIPPRAAGESSGHFLEPQVFHINRWEDSIMNSGYWGVVKILFLIIRGVVFYDQIVHVLRSKLPSEMLHVSGEHVIRWHFHYLHTFLINDFTLVTATTKAKLRF